MRSIRRTMVQVPTLFSSKKDGGGRKKAKVHRDRYSNGEFNINPRGSNNFSYYEHWNKPDVRGALYAQQGRVCAYCGCKLTRGDRGDVEHFRPKKRIEEDLAHGGYWWLAYDFSNYVLSCGICNSNRKGSKFPLLDADVHHITFQEHHLIPSEARQLLDPTQDSIEDLMVVEWRDEVLCKVKPAANLSPTQQVRVTAIIDFFRLNRDSELVKERLEVTEKVTKLIDEGHPKEAGLYAVRYRPHSFVARQILVDQDLSQFLPTPDIEFEWLFKDLFSYLDWILKQLEHYPNDKIWRKQMDELLWSFTVLAVDPPDGAPPDLIEQLRNLGLQEMVEERIDKLPSPAVLTWP